MIAHGYRGEGMSGDEGRVPDFSTGFWKEFKLRYPRPAVYGSAAVAYLVLGLVLYVKEWGEQDEWAWVLISCVALGTAIASAVSAARSFASRKWRVAFRKQLPPAGMAGGARLNAITAEFWRRLLAALTGPGLTLLLLSIFFIFCAVALMTPSDQPGGAQLFIGVLLFLQAAVTALLAGVAGALAALKVRFRSRVSSTLLWMLITLLIKMLWFLPLVTGGLIGEWERPLIWILIISATDMVFTLVLVAVFGSAAIRTLDQRLSRAEPSESTDAEAIADSPETFGLEVSFWALLRWKFWRDPLVRAERRSLWTRGRLIAIWVVLLTLGICWPLSAFLMFTNRLWPFGGWWFMFLYRLLNMLAYGLGVWLAPALLASGLSGDKKSGALDAMILTPVAPLRLIAAKLVGRCWHLAVASFCSLLAAIVLWAYLVAETSVFSQVGLHVTAAYGMVGMLGIILSMLAYGAVGLYFAARFRSLLSALVCSYGFIVLVTAVRWAANSVINSWLSTYSYSSGADLDSRLLVSAAGGLLLLLPVGLILRAFLPAAARQLVIRRGE